MKLEIDNEVFFIGFAYDDPYTRVTVNGLEYLAVRSEKDKFVRRIGRKIALARALKDLSLSKETRTKIWEALKQKGMRLG